MIETFLSDSDFLIENASLRVAVVSDAAPHRNGVGAYYQDLERHLANRVDAMVTICPTIVDGKWKGGLPVPLPGDSTQKCMVPNVYGLYQKLKAFRADVVIVPTPGLYGIAGSFLGAKLGATVVVGFHTWYERLTELYWDRWQRRLTKGYFDVSNKILFHYAQHVVVNSDFMAKTAQEVGKCETQLVGTPVSYDFIHTPISPATGTLNQVLFVGRLAAEKNLDAIIAAARALPDMQFDIAGDGPERESIERAAFSLDNVNYLGWIDRSSLLQLIDAHDILVLPSHVESFGTVALETMARQRLALVSAHCGISEWQDLNANLLHMAKDETLTQALERLRLENNESRIAMAARARQSAVAQNDWNLARWLQFLTKVTGQA